MLQAVLLAHFYAPYKYLNDFLFFSVLKHPGILRCTNNISARAVLCEQISLTDLQIFQNNMLQRFSTTPDCC